mmetsp:Transcript_20195/g.37655  ORF Transcript_20195/g.37655 Transcript_20195/m.37655 type:complete len:334 (+) Transcript_20195:11-1012(+)
MKAIPKIIFRKEFKEDLPGQFLKAQQSDVLGPDHSMSESEGMINQAELLHKANLVNASSITHHSVSASQSLECIVSDLERANFEQSDSEEAIKRIIAESRPEPNARSRRSASCIFDELGSVMTTMASALDEERRQDTMRRWNLRQQILQLYSQTEPTPRLQDASIESQSSSAATQIGPGSSFLEHMVPEFPEYSPMKKHNRMRSVSITKTDDSCIVKLESDDPYEKPGNRRIVVNALKACLEQGSAPVIELLERSDSQHFVILLENCRNFLGLYRLDLRSATLHMMYGLPSCPQIITQSYGLTCFRFDAAERAFKQLKNKSLSIGTDAVSLRR